MTFGEASKEVETNVFQGLISKLDSSATRGGQIYELDLRTEKLFGLTPSP